MVLFIVAILASLIFYNLLMWDYLSGLKKLKKVIKQIDDPEVMVSVVVAMRNEEKNVKALCMDLLSQTYPSKYTEFILVDDHSEDQTYPFLKQMTGNDERFCLLKLNNKQQGKKAALRIGVKKATGEFILTTDTDCRLPKNWISGYVAYYKTYSPKLILGPVKITGEGLLTGTQQLEMLSLMGVTAGSASIGRPVMSNAANMGFVKQLYTDADLKEEIPTGDDVFLLEHAKKHHPGKTAFILSENAVVETGSSGFRQFVHQRIRWASKSRYYSDGDIQYAGWLVALTNGLLMITLFLSIKWPWFLLIYGAGLVLKSIPDILLIKRMASFFQQKNVVKLFFPMQIIYPLYATVFAFLGLILPYRWKGRKY